MIDGSQKRNRQLAFELQNSQVCEKRSNLRAILARNDNGTIKGTTTQIFISLDSSFSLKCMGPQIACSYLGWTPKENSVMYKYRSKVYIDTNCKEPQTNMSKNVGSKET